MGSPGQTPNDLFAGIGASMGSGTTTDPNTRRWSSEGKLIKASDPATILTPEQRYKRDYGATDAPRTQALFPGLYETRMDEYQKQYETEIKGGMADPELGLTTIQYG